MVSEAITWPISSLTRRDHCPAISLFSRTSRCWIAPDRVVLQPACRKQLGNLAWALLQLLRPTVEFVNRMWNRSRNLLCRFVAISTWRSAGACFRSRSNTVVTLRRISQNQYIQIRRFFKTADSTFRLDAGQISSRRSSQFWAAWNEKVLLFLNSFPSSWKPTDGFPEPDKRPDHTAVPHEQQVTLFVQSNLYSG